MRCEHCKKKFKPALNRLRRFCCNRCRAKAWYKLNHVRLVQYRMAWRRADNEKKLVARLARRNRVIKQCKELTKSHGR